MWKITTEKENLKKIIFNGESIQTWFKPRAGVNILLTSSELITEIIINCLHYDIKDKLYLNIKYLNVFLVKIYKVLDDPSIKRQKLILQENFFRKC